MTPATATHLHGTPAHGAPLRPLRRDEPGHEAPLADVIDLDHHRRVRRTRAQRRTYLRRRLVVLLAALALVTVGVLALGGSAEPVPAASDARVVVAPGQTLWDVAVAHAPAGTDPRVYVAQLQQVNGLRSPDVPAWTVLLLPASR